MILTKLKEYAETQMTLPPSMYAEVAVRWLINLNPDGTLRGFTPRGGNTKADKRGETMVAPHVTRTAGLSQNSLLTLGNMC